jgi:hypothetical protein
MEESHLPNLAKLTVANSPKRMRPNDNDEYTTEKPLETLLYHTLPPIPTTPRIALGGALPPLPINNIYHKNLICSNGQNSVKIPTATLVNEGPLGRRTLLYHSFINPCQPIYKGDPGDLGRIKWYAFESTMSFNFARESTYQPRAVAAAKQAAATDRGCSSKFTVNESFIDVYELRKPIENLMLFNDTRPEQWQRMGGHQDLLQDKLPCINEVANHIDPTIDTESPGTELNFAKRLHEHRFEDYTHPSGWIRLNSGVPLSMAHLKSFDPPVSPQLDRYGIYLAEIGYELMLSAENHKTHLRHLKRVRIEPIKDTDAFNVN